MDIAVKHLTKKYRGVAVLDNFNAVFAHGQTTCMMAPSGFGKTTLLRILMGLEPADSGTILGLSDCKISAVFQEDRLCENLSAVTNVRIVCPKTTPRSDIVRALDAVGLDSAVIYQPVRELSGGMKRRVAIVRGVLARSDVILMDEPFRGLDEETRAQTIEFVKAHTKGKTLLVVTHSAKEPELLGGTLMTMG